jgi:hypothetical protein
VLLQLLHLRDHPRAAQPCDGGAGRACSPARPGCAVHLNYPCSPVTIYVSISVELLSLSVKRLVLLIIIIMTTHPADKSTRRNTTAQLTTKHRDSSRVKLVWSRLQAAPGARRQRRRPSLAASTAGAPATTPRSSRCAPAPQALRIVGR